MFNTIESITPGLILLGMIILIGFLTLLLILTTDTKPTEHNMGNGIICYTFGGDINCLQVER